MPSYTVVLSRTYGIEADDREHAVAQALELLIEAISEDHIDDVLDIEANEVN